MPSMTLVRAANGQIRGKSDADNRAYNRFKRWRRQLGAGEFFQFSYDYERNLKHHNKFMALVSYIADNSDTYNTTATALIAVKIAAGHCDFVPDPKNGGLVAVPRSISFKSMKQDAFEEFYKNALQGVADHVLPHMNRVDLQDALEKIARFE
jgi:hypothetical protein